MLALLRLPFMFLICSTSQAASASSPCAWRCSRSVEQQFGTVLARVLVADGDADDPVAGGERVLVEQPFVDVADLLDVEAAVGHLAAFLRELQRLQRVERLEQGAVVDRRDVAAAERRVGAARGLRARGIGPGRTGFRRTRAG